MQQPEEQFAKMSMRQKMHTKSINILQKRFLEQLSSRKIVFVNK